MALTDTRLRTLKPAEGKAECLVADGNGLYVRVRASRGSFLRTWQYRRKEKGKPSITVLGTYPEMSIKEARLKAAELATKRQTASQTVEEVAEEWLKERVDHTHRKADLVRGYVDRAVIPELGSLRVRDVEPADVARAIRVYRDRVATTARGRTGGRPAARALLAVCKGLFGYAVASGWISMSPAAQLTAAVAGPPPQARSRVLSDDEIRMVMMTDIPAGPTLRFLLLTGLRLGEAYNGHRDGQYWVVPAGFSKNKREHKVWLSDLALAQLKAHPWKTPRTALQKWVTYQGPGWTAHDLRRTFSTRNNDMGVAPYIVEKMLNHTFDGAMAAYNYAAYDVERRAALEAWSAWLRGLTAPPAEVLRFRSAERDAA